MYCMGGCLSVGICWHDKRKTPDRNDLKIDTVVVLDIVSKPIDFGFKRSGFRVKVRAGVRMVASGSEIIQECDGCHRI